LRSIKLGGLSLVHGGRRQYRPRIVDIEIDMLTGDYRAHRGLAIDGAKTVPCARRNDGDHSSAERKRVRPVLLDDVESRRSVENVNQLVLGMGLPMAGPGGLAKKQEPVTVTRQLRGAAFALGARRLRCLPAEHGELRAFCREIDDVGRSALHLSLHQ
jgi:hypothetical protein